MILKLTQNTSLHSNWIQHVQEVVPLQREHRQAAAAFTIRAAIAVAVVSPSASCQLFLQGVEVV